MAGVLLNQYLDYGFKKRFGDEKLTVKDLHMPNSVQTEYGLKTPLDKWRLFIKKSADLQDILVIFKILKDNVIEPAFKNCDLGFIFAVVAFALPSTTINLSNPSTAR